MIDFRLLEYVRVPNFSAKLLLLLAKLLIRRKPGQSNAIIEQAAADLEQQAASTQAALTARLRAANPEIAATEADFDRATDALWVTLRKLLELMAVYGHEGLDALGEKAKIEAELETLRERARRAAKLYERLFASEGTIFVTFSFVEQVASMATVLDLIERDGLEAELVELVGPELPRLIQLCQRRYEEMVDDRVDRERSLAVDLQGERSQLRWYIFAYNNAVLTLLDPKQPESAAIVEHALKPMVRLRVLAPTLEQGAGEGQALEVEEELEALADIVEGESGESGESVETG